MSKVKTVDFLVSEWGHFRAPPDLMKLWNAAPKRTVEYEFEGENHIRTEPDPTTAKGSAFCARERALLDAISLIFATGTMEVVNVETPKEA
jgi:hypothetical protein